MRRAIYGYMRVLSNQGDPEDVARIKDELSEYAEREGFTLKDVFTEIGKGAESAFYAMLDTLKRSDASNVITPSLWHFAGLPGLQETMKSYIEREINAHIWVVQGQRR